MATQIRSVKLFWDNTPLAPAYQLLGGSLEWLCYGRNRLSLLPSIANGGPFVDPTNKAAKLGLGHSLYSIYQEVIYLTSLCFLHICHKATPVPRTRELVTSQIMLIDCLWLLYHMPDLQVNPNFLYHLWVLYSEALYVDWTVKLSHDHFTSPAR